jgi:hypothetical protein
MLQLLNAPEVKKSHESLSSAINESSRS